MVKGEIKSLLPIDWCMCMVILACFMVLGALDMQKAYAAGDAVPCFGRCNEPTVEPMVDRDKALRTLGAMDRWSRAETAAADVLSNPVESQRQDVPFIARDTEAAEYREKQRGRREAAIDVELERNRRSVCASVASNTAFTRSQRATIRSGLVCR